MSLDTGMTILVVDDSGTMRIMFKKMLNEAGFENITMAVDGLDAINKIKEQKVDLIISDWNMPNKDGLSLLKWVRQEKSAKHLPFIMATAQGDKTQKELVKKEGGDGHIAKPFDAPQLRAEIEEVFGLKKADSTPKRKPAIVNGKVQLKLGHIQITDHLALGILKHQIQSGQLTPKYFDLETVCMPGWNPIETALEKGQVDGAFVLAPIAMDLFAFDVPIKLVAFAHKNGSSFVRNANYSSDDYSSLVKFYKYKVINIPHKMSIHNMLAHIFLSDLGLRPGVPGEKPINVRFEVVPPIKMPGIMKENENVAGFVVAEPIASNAVSKGIAELQFISSAIWKNHPCCVLTMQDDFLNEHSDAAYELVSLLVQAGKIVEENKDKAAEIAVSFLDPNKQLGLSTDVLKKVLQEPDGIKMDDLYPVLEDLDRIQRYMHNDMNIGKLIDIEKFVDLQFMDAVVKS